VGAMDIFVFAIHQFSGSNIKIIGSYYVVVVV